MDRWPYWQFEENIKIVNEINEDEEKQRKSEEDSQQNNMPSFNPNSILNGIGDISKNIGSFKP